MNWTDFDESLGSELTFEKYMIWCEGYCIWVMAFFNLYMKQNVSIPRPYAKKSLLSADQKYISTTQKNALCFLLR